VGLLEEWRRKGMNGEKNGEWFGNGRGCQDC